MCEVMAADPVTARFVGRPNVFVSHAWLYLFDDVLAALKAFDAACGAEAERFYWFDTFSIDEHATQSMSQTWWSTTFRCVHASSDEARTHRASCGVGSRSASSAAR
jgi:hypothetical protein